VAQAQYDATMKVPAGQPLKPGDLVFFGSGVHAISHVGIYIGNNQMIDAPHTGAQVRVENYQWGDYVGATRPTDNTGVTVAAPQSPVAASGSNYTQVLSRVMQALTTTGAK
jgi:hypothetical protein